MSAPNKRKLSSGKWMWGLGAQRKRALEVGRVTSPGSYRALSPKPQGRRTGKGTGLPSHRIASHLFIEKDQNLKNNLPSRLLRALPTPPRPKGSWSHWRFNSLQQSAPDTDLFQPLRGPSGGEPLPRVLPFGAGQQAPGMGGGASTGRGMRTRGDGSHNSRGGGRRRRKRRRWTRRRRRRRRLLWQLRRMLRRGAGLGARGVGSRAPHGLGMRARLGV